MGEGYGVGSKDESGERECHASLSYPSLMLTQAKAGDAWQGRACFTLPCMVT